MELTVHIQYNTQWGENVYIVGSIPELGNWDNRFALRMQYSGNGEWKLSVPVFVYKQPVEFRFLIVRDGETEREEYGMHQIILPNRNGKINIRSVWKDKPEYTIFGSSAFTKCIFAHKQQRKPQFSALASHLLNAFVPNLKGDETLILTGNNPALGNWDPEKGIKLTYTTIYTWETLLPPILSHIPLEYKFVIKKKSTKSFIWEKGPNHTLQIESPSASGESFLIEHNPDFARSKWKGAGVSIPVFSLRSNESWGIGEFSDLKLLIDWAASCGMSFVQILPVNDTTTTHTWSDSYPYNAISIYALHPLYLHLPSMEQLKDKRAARRFEKESTRLNSLRQVDYDRVDTLKWEYFRLIYQQEKNNLLQNKDFGRFISDNQEWLMPYAAYSYLRDLYKESNFSKWPENSIYKKEEIDQLCDKSSPAYDEIIFYCYLQYHLHLQLNEITQYANSKGIVLKGDIPIGINRTGVEAWMSPQLFHLNMQAGAPPDDFAEEGQNWGFPTYNWDEMKKDGYTWWIKRFTQMAEYFNAYRIDHILGFFRIWEIPCPYINGLAGRFNPALPLSIEEIEARGFRFNADKYAHLTSSCEVLFLEDTVQKAHYHPRIDAYKTHLYQMLDDNDRYAYDQIYWNYFYKRHNEFWKEKGLEKLSILTKCTNMLACGEDLGMIPACVPDVMNRLQILSLEIERMPKTPGIELEDLSKLPYLSVCSTSTHDMTTIRGWWKETQGYDCPPAICEQILHRHLSSSAILTIFPLQDWLSIDAELRNGQVDEERINVPAISNYYWRYRMHLSLETLCASKEFTRNVKKLVQERNNEGE